LNKNAIHKQIRYGPYVIPGANEPTVGVPEDPKDVKGAFSFATNLDPICSDCMVLRGGAVLEFANGTHASIADGIYNHHVITNNYGKKEHSVTCPGSSVSIPKSAGLFIAAGNDHGDQLYTSEDGSFKSGYYIKPTDTFDMEGEFMNYNAAPQTIYVVIDFEYLPGKPEGYLDAHSLTLSVAPCNETAFKLPRPQYSKTSQGWTVPADGYIVNIRGHEHDGGAGVHVSVNGRNTCNSIPTYGGQKDYEAKGEGQGWETISEMSFCPQQVKLTKGDTITVTADYDIAKHPLRMNNMGNSEDVMGIAVINLAFPVGFEIP
jgi:hypothetical protein